MATAKKGLPEDWQKQAMEAKKKLESEDPTRTVFGLLFPESWKAELMPYVRNGDVSRLLHVRAIGFSGTSVGRLEPPETKEAKKAS